MQIITNNKEKINLNRLPIYDKADMIKVYEARYKKKPANDNELLDGLNSDDIDNMNKRYSLVSFFTKKNYSKTSNSFYLDDLTNHKIYMQGGCTDGVNLYYIFYQKESGSVCEKSAIIKVHCGGIKKSNGDGKIYRYYVDKNEIRFNKFKSSISSGFLNMAHHANDVVYIPDLPVLVNGKVVKKPYLLVCGSFSFYLIDPNTLEVVNNNLIYLKGMFNLAGDNPITHEVNFSKSPKEALYVNLKDYSDDDKTAYLSYSVAGVTYNRQDHVLILNYNYINETITDDPDYKCKFNISYKFEDDPEKMSSNMKFIGVKPVYYKNGKYVVYDHDASIVMYMEYTPLDYNGTCGIDTDNTRVFHCRANKVQSINRIYLFNPSYKNGLFDAYKLKKYYQVIGDDSFQFNEIENICYRKLSSGNYRFFIGFKGYKYKSNEMKYGTILYYDCTPSQL